MVLQHRLRQPGNLVAIADIGDDRQRRSTGRHDLVGAPLGAFGVDIGDDHLGAVLRDELELPPAAPETEETAP